MITASRLSCLLTRSLVSRPIEAAVTLCAFCPKKCNAWKKRGDRFVFFLLSWRNAARKKNNHSRTFQLAAQKPLALCSPTTVHTAHCFLYLSCWWHTLDTILQHITTAVKWRRPWTHHYSFIVAPFCNWIHRVWKIRQNEVRRKFLLLPQWTFLYSVILLYLLVRLIYRRRERQR